MSKIYDFIWNCKKQILCFTLVVIAISVIKLKDFKIYFESERIINELSTEEFLKYEQSNINDENIFIATITCKDTFIYEDFIEIKNLNLQKIKI